MTEGKGLNKSEIAVQRKIGQQLLLLSIIQHEEERAQKCGFSFVDKERLALWSAMDREELDHFLQVCGTLDSYTVGVEAAQEYIKRDDFYQDDNVYLFVLSTIHRYGDFFVLRCNLKDNGDLKLHAKHNYHRFNSLYESFIIGQSMATAEEFKKMISFYICYYVKRIKDALSEGYDWDVVKKATQLDLSEERFHEIASDEFLEGAFHRSLR